MFFVTEKKQWRIKEEIFDVIARYYPFMTKIIRKQILLASLGIVYNAQCDMSVCLIYKIRITRYVKSSTHWVSLKDVLIMN